MFLLPVLDFTFDIFKELNDIDFTWVFFSEISQFFEYGLLEGFKAHYYRLETWIVRCVHDLCDVVAEECHDDHQYYQGDEYVVTDAWIYVKGLLHVKILVVVFDLGAALLLNYKIVYIHNFNMNEI